MKSMASPNTQMPWGKKRRIFHLERACFSCIAYVVGWPSPKAHDLQWPVHSASTDTSKVAACPDKSKGIATELMPALTWHGPKPKTKTTRNNKGFS